MTKRAFVSGVSGQDGSYLAELLLGKGYEVHGLIRRSSTNNLSRIEGILGRITLHYGDMTESLSLVAALKDAQPDEIYNLAAQSHVGISFQTPVDTINVTGLGAIRLFEAARLICPDARIYQASSSEMFGSSPPPQKESSAFRPRSPYGVAKVMAHQAAALYRDAYAMFISCGILFNHESERRGEQFVTRKITLGIADILAGKQSKLGLGFIRTMRDWGYAPEYVAMMHFMLQQDKPDDYVIGTGETHSVEEFVRHAFALCGLIWRDYVYVDLAEKRPAEVYTLLADSSKAQKELGWDPQVKFHDLVRIMVENDARGLIPIPREKGA